ncbi:MAG: PEP/pyruvate-binding domain-containing protein [Desulfobacca sp.]|uniref:PEP/pyruvate-binding domain-containing protein n=1 Tax=Desulfobacca sp. TaxID=2067990 RepID=UPI004049C471
MGVLDWFRRKNRTDDAGMAAFQKKYESFKCLLDANNNTLELMARLEAVAEGDFIFDMQFIRSRSQAILQKVGTIVAELNKLGDNRYQALSTLYEDLREKITQEITAPADNDSTPLVMPLSQVDRRHLHQVGGKNANLGELKNRLHLPTPEGFVITNASFRLLIQENHLSDRIRNFLDSLSLDNLEMLTVQGRELQEAVRHAAIPKVLQEEVAHHYQALVETLGYQPTLALRSSGIYEDQEYSFAGLFLTRLNVPFADFFPAYLEVLASQFNRRALVYLCQKRLVHREQAMSVGCLAMVPAVASGVLFTADPMGQRQEVMLVDATWGLGPAVVDGTVTPDRFVLSKKPPLAVVEQQIQDKPVLLQGAKSQAGLATVAVAADQRRQPALTQEQLLTLGRYALRLEEYFGEPLDLEFAVDPQGRLLIMQARPLLVEAPALETGRPAALSDGEQVLLDGGTVACFGVAAGPVHLIHKDEDLADFPEGAILVARHTSARYGMVLHKARGMVIDIGSATSHLAILAREFKVPALVDTRVATKVLQPGRLITVDATHMRVYAGEVHTLVEQAQKRTPSPMVASPLYAKLRRVMRWITPLNLVDPKLSDLTPENCKTLHDITRFAHQLGIKEMFDLAEKASQQDDIHSVRLKTNIPFNLHIIDLGGGIDASRRAKFVPPEAITSIPLRALWRGISHPDISWAGPIPIDVKGLYAVVSRSLTAASDHSDFWSRTFAIISYNYLNYSSRLGYHFATIDAYVSDIRNDNYITFRFKGGAADEVRRGRRVRFLGAVLEKLDFEVEVTGDLVVGRLWKYPRELLEEKLDMLGRLMGCARQRDMLMADDAIVDWYTEAFLAGNYRFAGGPQLPPATPAQSPLS